MRYMRLKQILCLLLLVLVLWGVGCGTTLTDRADEGNESDSPQTQTNAEDAARLAYYEQMVNDLQAEVLAMKAELFSAKSEYEARLAELESKGEQTAGKLPFTYSVADSGVTITAYTGTDVNVAIPATIDGKPVVAIGDKAFLNNKTVQSVVVPEGVKEIGWFAFSGCIALGAINLPASISSISYGAFENCPQALTVFSPKDSYAQRYAQSYGIVFSGT